MAGRWGRLAAALRAPSGGWRWLVAGLAATVLALGAGAAVKAPCLSHPWDGFQYTHRCYNDLVPLYSARHFDRQEMPYATFEPPGEGERLEDARGFNEYPVVTGLVQWGASFAPGGSAGFFWANAAVLSACALATTVLLWRGRVPGGWLLASALAPPLALYAFNNWDLLAVALATAGLVAHRRGHPLLAGVWLALGASAKVYPALLLVLVGCDLLRAERGLGRAGWSFGLAAVGTLAAVNVPFLLANAPGWLATYQFHLGRGPTLEAPWTMLAHWAVQRGGAAWDPFFTKDLPGGAGLVLLAAVASLAVAVARGRLRVEHAALVAVALFLALNKVHSVQYALWVVPLLALAPVRWWLALPYLVGDLLVFWTLWPFFHDLERGGDSWAVLTLAVLLRWGGQFVLAGGALSAGWQARAPWPRVGGLPQQGVAPKP